MGQSVLRVNTDITKDNRIEANFKIDEFGSLFRISQMTGVDLEKIMTYNNISKSEFVSKDDIIKVLIDPNKLSIRPANDDKSYVFALMHTLKTGETLYRISKSILGREVKEFCLQNKISESNYKPGIEVTLGYINVQGNEIVINKEVKIDTTSVASVVAKPEPVYIKERGIAYVARSQNQGRFVLHPFAKLNSEIQIYSPFLRKSVRAKVVGRIPQGTYMSDTDIVLSSSTAKSLGALDSRFKVELIYQDPNQEVK
jgi:hypothetical protein